MEWLLEASLLVPIGFVLIAIGVWLERLGFGGRSDLSLRHLMPA